MEKEKNKQYRAKIMKFPKEVIVDAAIFACFGADKIYSRCVEYEHERLMKQTDDLETEIEEITKGLEKAKNSIEKIIIYKQIEKLRDKQFAIYDKIDKLFQS